MSEIGNTEENFKERVHEYVEMRQDMLLVILDPPPEKIGQIFIGRADDPDSGKRRVPIPRAPSGFVILAGPGKRLLKTGELLPMSNKVGDRVTFVKHVGQPLDIEGHKLCMVFDDDVLAVFKDKYDPEASYSLPKMERVQAGQS